MKRNPASKVLLVTRDIVKEAREAAGDTQAAAAARLRVSVGAWRKWESGERLMPSHALELYEIKVKAGWL